MNKKFIINKGFGEIKIQNFFLIKKIKKIKNHFFINKKDLKCKILISKIFHKIKKNIIYLKKKI
ncbi:30S ribosomal protein S15 [Candidatus Carsonella ruddii]|nr:30S ribosomal protein S15 [Candidatus Carsonella ruddii]